MKKYRKQIAIVLIVGIVYLAFDYYPRLNIITGFAAKSMASGIFLANRTKSSVEEGDNGFWPIFLANNKIDANKKSVSATFFGLQKRTAKYIDGIGAILVNDDFDSKKGFKIPHRTKVSLDLPFPYGNQDQKDTVFKEVNYRKLKNVVDGGFDLAGEHSKKTRSVLVVYKDQIIAEKYAEGFDRNTPILGWSMTKSITSTLYGVLAKEDKIDIYSKTGIEEWENDERKHITYNDLLHMNSGLEWEEDYGSMTDVTKMLYMESDMGQAQIKKELLGAPNQNWNYSSGTTNILSGPLLRKQFSDHQEYLDFWYEALLDKIGMHSALIETDLQGNYVGSSYGWANTRDWAKFGLLYMHEGNWNGEQILDTTWVKYVATPTNTSEGRYGAQFWLNAGGHYPDVPRDLFSANGFQGQFVFIIPSKGLTIVRTGLTEEDEFDFNGFLREIVSCFN